ENASNVGRAAGVALPGRVPVYVTHLRQLGLADSGPEDPGLDVEYDILATETEVRLAKAEADRRGRLPGRMVRRTLRISAFGRDLWEACRPPSDDGPDPTPAPPA
ncbi:MAG: Abi-alpha family protein, partial [Thermoplasmata archaeon]